jgi:hypothetical protein
MKNDTEAPTDVEEFNPLTATDREKLAYYQRSLKEFRWDLTAHDNYIKDFDAYEAMLISKPYDSISKKVQNGLSDGRTTTIYLERAGRVVGKLPEGEMQAAGENDDGVAAVLEILRTKWLYPNANAQKKFLKKIRLWQFNSSVYGFMPMFYDWNVTETGYVGPDCWLWHPRNFIPQLGRASIDDMDYCHTITYVGEDYLEDLLEETDEAGWDKDEIRRLIQLIHDGEKSVDVNNQRNSLVVRQRQFQAEKGRIMLATRYEAGDDGNWLVFAPEYNEVVLRCIPNPHKNGRLPFVIKYATDLFDNIYGLGDFQRAKPLQFANDGLDNFYFAGIKRGLYPPTIINPAGVVKSSITQDPGAIWLENVPNSIREYHTDPVGMSTYQSAKQIMNGAQTFQAGSTQIDATAAGSSQPTMSRTDAGVDQQTAKEDTRDAQDRFELESALEELIDRMMGLIPVIGTETIPVNLFKTDVQELIDSGYGDSLNVLKEKKILRVSTSGDSATLKIPADFLKDMDMRFHMTYGSTAQQNKQAQLQSLDQFVKDMTSMQNEIVEMKNQGMTIDWKLIAEIKARLSDVPQLGKIFRQMTPEEEQKWQASQQQANQPPQQHPMIKMIESMGYKDMPPDIQRQAEAMAGFTPSTVGVSTADHLKTVQAATAMHSAVQGSPEMQAALQAEQPPATPAAPAPPDANLGPLPLAMHGSQPIVDPDMAALHNHLGSLIKTNGK